MNWMTLFQTVMRWPVRPAFAGVAAMLVAAVVAGWVLPARADDGLVRVTGVGGQVGLSVEGDPDDEWRFESTRDFVSWTGADTLGAVYAGRDGTGRLVSVGATEPGRFYRAVRTSGLYDNRLLRTISLTFTQANWATLLANGRNTGSNTVGNLSMDNGDVVFGVGARYKGNTSYSMGGTKKSVNIELNHTNESARLMGFRTINLNNAAGDETILREPIYFRIGVHRT